MKLNNLGIGILFFFSCNQFANNTDYNTLSTYQVLDTNKFYTRKYIQNKDDKAYQIAFTTCNILIRRDTANFDYYLNKFNLLSFKQPLSNAILYSDSVFTKFKTDSSAAVTILLAKGNLQEKLSDKNAIETYRKADLLAWYDISKHTDVISIDNYITYVMTGALAYNKDTVNNRIEKYRKVFPLDTSTINALRKIKPQD